LLNTELAVSEISGKRYRVDEQIRSAVSGKSGHKDEFITCYETQQPMALSEAEQCELTGKRVRPGILQLCEVTGRRVLPSELERCTVTGKRALRRLLVSSSFSQVRVLENAAIRSATGRFCAPAESRTCFWSDRKYHPDDLRTCTLTGLPIYFEFATNGGPIRLQPLVELLDGIRRTADEAGLWNAAVTQISASLKGGKCKVEAAILSPAKAHLAICCEVRTLLGIRVHQLGVIYDLRENAVIGRLAEGKRGDGGWVERKH
jgi:hypothetical protein